MRKSTIVAVLAAALMTPAVRAADVSEADYQKAMKETLAGMQAVGKTMRENTGELTAAAAAAKNIEAALASIDAFWTARKDDEAVKMNNAAREAALAVAKAASTNDQAATGEAVKALQGTCKACHDVHREQLPDRTYKIK